MNNFAYAIFGSNAV